VSWAARLFGLDALPDHDTRYERADEVVSAVTALWESWEDGALPADQVSGWFADNSKIHPVSFHGRHVTIEGALNVPRSPQGRPIVLQAGGSPQGVALAARYADAVFTVNHTLEAAKGFYTQVKSLAGGHGRRPEDVLVLPGLFPVIGSTEQEARSRKDWLDELAGVDDELAALAGTIGLAPEDLKLDAELPWSRIEAGENKGASQGFRTAVLNLARRESLTVRELLKRNPAGHRSVVGTPEQIADTIEEWFRADAADGFNLNTDFFPEGLELIVNHLVPELQRRGIFRTEYESSTLRGNLGLPLLQPLL
jgi:FMN-dependent oxidoreductase (nitrilotriacetate monooxygenase family)